MNFVVISHAFTGLQCRARYYLYLVACIVFPSEPTPVPEGRVSSVCHQICGFTYNTINHLNIFPDQKPGSLPYFISSNLFLRAIKREHVQNRFSATHSSFLSQFYCTARTNQNPSRLVFFSPRISRAHFGNHLVFCRKLWYLQKIRPGPSRNRACRNTPEIEFPGGFCITILWAIHSHNRALYSANDDNTVGVAALPRSGL